MSSIVTKETVLEEFRKRYGNWAKLEGSQSLFEFPESNVRLYFRYSRIHSGDRAFFGLRQEDLASLSARPSVICFLWDDQTTPLFLPYDDYEEVFNSVTPAKDGQYKAQIYFSGEGTDLYLARKGRFNVDAHFGWESLDGLRGFSEGNHETPLDLSHSQIQTLLGAIGIRKTFDVWIPVNDRNKLDHSIAEPFSCCGEIPSGLGFPEARFPEIDVLWIEKGSGKVRAMFEVEHSTPIYSGLLRFNDVHLVASSLKPSFTIVANHERRSTFIRQLERPTFRASNLAELCTFMKYEEVVAWYRRIRAA